MTVAHDEARSILFQNLGHEISWADECPWTGGFCFGTETGELLLCDPEGELEAGCREFLLAEEAINGVAFWQDFVGVSTRAEVSIFQFNQSLETPSLLVSIPNGAHGILSTKGGRFFAPMGRGGF